MKNASKPLLERYWIKLWFSYPALSPVAWGCGCFLSMLLILWAGWGLVLESFPHVLFFLLMLAAVGLQAQIESLIYRPLAHFYDGGWMPSLQRTFLFWGLFALIGLSVYLFMLNMLLGGLAFVALIGYSMLYLPRSKRQHNPLQAFAELANATQRIQAPGIRQVERLCLWACLVLQLSGLLSLLDVLIVTARPVYRVHILSTEIHRGGKGGPSYSVTLTGWKNSAKLLKQSITLADYHKLVPDRDYLMSTRQGLWGTERLSGFKLQPAANH